MKKVGPLCSFLTFVRTADCAVAFFFFSGNVKETSATFVFIVIYKANDIHNVYLI